MAGLILSVSDSGNPKVVAKRLIESGDKSVLKMKKVMDKIFMDMLRVNMIQIKSEGHRGGGLGGGSYAALKPRTQILKGSSKILFTADANTNYKKIKGPDLLVSSVTKFDAKYQMKKVTRDRVELGTKRPRAYVHQYGSTSRNIPARPFLIYLDTDEERWKQWIAGSLMTPFEKKETDK